MSVWPILRGDPLSMLHEPPPVTTTSRCLQRLSYWRLPWIVVCMGAGKDIPHATDQLEAVQLLPAQFGYHR